MGICTIADKGSIDQLVQLLDERSGVVKAEIKLTQRDAGTEVMSVHADKIVFNSQKCFLLTFLTITEQKLQIEMVSLHNKRLTGFVS